MSSRIAEDYGVSRPSPLASAAIARLACIAHGVRLAAAVILALFISYSLELDNAFWSGITAAVVCQPSLGGSLQKGRVRVLGTIVGAVAIVAITAIFPQSRIGMFVSIAFWIGVCGFFATILRNFGSYGAALAGFTTAVIFADVIMSPDETLILAFTRTSEICIGIGSASFVFIVTHFGNSRRRLADALADVTRAVAGGIADTLVGGVESGKERAERRQFAKRVLALDGLIDEAVGEAAELRSRSTILHASIEGLFSALSAWRGIANHIDAMGGEISQQEALVLHPSIVNAVGGDWLAQPERMRSMCGEEARRILATPARDPSTRLLIDQIAEALLALQQAANGIVLLMTPGAEWPNRRGGWMPVADYLPAVLNGFRCMLAILAAEAIWVETEWSNGQTMLTFTAVAITVFSPGGSDAYKNVVNYSAGTIIAYALATAVDLAILPGQHDFLGLSLVLAACLIPVGALSATPWRKSLMAALTINFMAILSPQNQPTYDPGQFLNMGLAVVVGTMVASLAMRLIPPLSPARRTARRIDLTQHDLRRAAVGRRWLSRANWISLVSCRLEAMPPEANPQRLADLVAMLSLGEAIIRLRDRREQLPGQSSLDRTLACFGSGDGTAARYWLSDFVKQQSDGEAPEALAGLRARAAAFAIIDVLGRHPSIFGPASKA